MKTCIIILFKEPIRIVNSDSKNIETVKELILSSKNLEIDNNGIFVSILIESEFEYKFQNDSIESINRFWVNS